jgi:hypothetical protein
MTRLKNNILAACFVAAEWGMLILAIRALAYTLNACL